MLALGACGGDEEAGPSSGQPPGGSAAAVGPADTALGVPASLAVPPPAVEQLAAVAIVAEPAADLPKLTSMATRPVDGSLYFGSQTGEVWRVTDGTAPVLALDLTAVVSPYESGSERGLLGLAFSPLDGRLFVYYTDAQIDSQLVSYAVGVDGSPDPASVWRVLTIDQPGVGHKGGGMSFSADGVLYLAVGDGGGSNGRDAQDHTKLLGAIVRILPRMTAEGYDLPADNPYIGDDLKRPELWAKGLRNPWGFWRDHVTGDLWTGDVGESALEEIDRIPAGVAGANLGWYYIEGTQVNHQGAPADVLAPVHVYRHDEIGPAVIGGCVYRGEAIPALRGAYVFGDMAGATFALGAGDAVTRLQLSVGGILTGFGLGPDGELYALTLEAGAFRLVAG